MSSAGGIRISMRWNWHQPFPTENEGWWNCRWCISTQIDWLQAVETSAPGSKILNRHPPHLLQYRSLPPIYPSLSIYIYMYISISLSLSLSRPNWGVAKVVRRGETSVLKEVGWMSIKYLWSRSWRLHILQSVNLRWNAPPTIPSTFIFCREGLVSISPHGDSDTPCWWRIELD